MASNNVTYVITGGRHHVWDADGRLQILSKGDLLDDLTHDQVRKFGNRIRPATNEEIEAADAGEGGIASAAAATTESTEDTSEGETWLEALDTDWRSAVALVNAQEDVESLQDLIEAESGEGGKSRASVLDAAAERIEELDKGDNDDGGNS